MQRSTVKTLISFHPTVRVEVLLCILLTMMLGLFPSLSHSQSLPLQQLLIHPISNLESVAYSPNGKLVAVGGYGGARIYTLATGAYVSMPMRTGEEQVGVHFAKNGSVLAVNSLGVMDLFNVTDGKLIESITFPSALNVSVAFSPDGSEFAIGGQGNSGEILQLWSATNYKLLKSFSTSFWMIGPLAFSADSQTLADGGNGLSVGIELWNVSSGKLISKLTSAASIGLDSLSFSPDGLTLADGGSSTGSGVVELWSVPTGKLKSSLKTSANLGVSTVEFSPDGKTIALCGLEQLKGVTTRPTVVELWNVSSARLATNLDIPSSSGLATFTFSPDGKTIAGAGWSDSTTSAIEFWSVTTSTLSRSIETSNPFACSAVAYSLDGSTIASGSGMVVDGVLSFRIGLWNASSGSQTKSFSSVANNSINAVAFSTDGKFVADGGKSIDSEKTASGVLELWSATTGKSAEGFRTAEDDGVNSVAFSPDGKTVAAGGTSSTKGGVVEIWSQATGALLSTLPIAPYGQVTSIAFSPDGKTLAVGGCYDSTGLVEILDVATGKLIRNLSTEVGSLITSVAFSPDGTVLADSGYTNAQMQQIQYQSGLLERWNVATGNAVGTPISTAPVPAYWVTFSPDSKILFASFGSLFAVSTVNQNYLLFDYDFYAESIAVAPNGHQLALAGANGSLVVLSNPLEGAVAVSEVSINPSTVVGGSTTTGVVSLSSPAPSGGLWLNLSTNSPATTLPPIVTVAAGATTATFNVTTFPVGANTSVSITASDSLGGKAGTFTVVPPTLKSVILTPAKVAGGATSTGTVTLNGTAAASTTILLSSSSRFAVVPKQVTIPAGKSSATFTIQTSDVTTTSTAMITAAQGSTTQTAILTIS